MTGALVVKLGGSTLGSHDTSLADIAAIYTAGRPVVVVHGGGSLVSEWLAARGLQPRFVRGLRATDAQSLEVVVAVLCGLVNKRLAAELAAFGAPAAGLSGADGGIIRARRFDPELGFVGQIEAVDGERLTRLTAAGFLPVLAPIALENGDGPPQLLNTNADTCAGEVAAALGAQDLVFLTDVPGVLADGEVLPEVTAASARRLLAEGTVAGGMIPKLEAALRAAAAGCRTWIVDGREAGALPAALEGGGSGTRVVPAS